MSFVSKFLSKKKANINNNNDGVFYPEGNDGQDLYFKEEFEEKPKKKSSATKKASESSNVTEAKTPKKVKTETKPKAEIKKEQVSVKKETSNPAPTKASAANPKAKSETAKTAPTPAKKAAPKVKSEPAKSASEKKPAPKAKKEPAKAASAPKKEPAKAASAPKKEPISKTSAALSQKEIKTAKSGRFEIKKAKDGRYVFNLYAPNHIIVATSQVYSTASAAVNGIQSIIANAEKAPIEDNTLKNPVKHTFPKWEMYIDKGGDYRFRLFASNGNCVVHSQGYKQKSSCKNGIDSIIRCSRNAEIDKSYLKKE